MNLVEALQKYKQVTNDWGKTIYSTNNTGQIISCTNNLTSTINPTIDLLTSTGWEEYTELVLPKRGDNIMYYHIDDWGDVDLNIDDNSNFDLGLFENHNYFLDEGFAKYVSDKQYIQRTNLILEHLNKDNPDKDMLISEYILKNHKEVIDRIKEYEARV